MYSLLYDRLYTWLFAVFTDGSIDWYSLGDVGMFVSTELVSNDRASNLHIYIYVESLRRCHWLSRMSTLVENEMYRIDKYIVTLLKT